MEYKSKIILCIIFITFLFYPAICVRIKAAPPKVYLDPDTKVLEFTTKDTAATSVVSWETLGFTVKNNKTKGFPKRKDLKSRDLGRYGINENDYVWDKEKDQYGQFLLGSSEKSSTTEDGVSIVTFRFNREKVTEQFENANVSPDVLSVTGGKVYLNAILRVNIRRTMGGGIVATKGPYYTLKGIQNAESWRNPGDFDDRFDIPVPYEPEKQNVTLQLKEYYKGKITDVGKAKLLSDSIRIGGTYNPKKDISNTITSEQHNKKVYLYRVYYLKNKDKKKQLGNLKTSANALLDPSSYEIAIKPLRDRALTVADGGIEIVAIYKIMSKKEDTEDSETIESELPEPNPTGIIQADIRGQENFDAEKGVPVTENLYVNVKTPSHLLDFIYKRISGKKFYSVTVNVTYHLKWKERITETDASGHTIDKEENKSKDITVPQVYTLERDYSYWEIERLNIYGISKAEVENYALPNEKATLLPSTSPPDIKLDKTAGIVDPEFVKINADGGTIVGDDRQPDILFTDMQAIAEKGFGKIKVSNDTLIFSGKTYMDGTVCLETTKQPLVLPAAGDETDDNVLYQSGMAINRGKANGEFESIGNLFYQRTASYGESEGDMLEFGIDDINQVIIHTPVVCDGKVSTNKADNQMLQPDKSSASLILDRKFTVVLPTEGNHLNIKGYQYRDYKKYIDKRQVQFPFDVYYNNNFIRAGNWFVLNSETTEFYLPIWVEEGQYDILFKTLSINSSPNSGLYREEELANLELENYTATDSAMVEVSGRLYNFRLYDISDYPLWQSIFRKKASLELSGFDYSVGTKNQNGNITSRNSKYTFPLIRGSHPSVITAGIIKSGYVLRFSLTTIGEMNKNSDYIHINPKFYYIEKDGTKRKEVDIYYSETFEGKKNHLVLIGSEQDKRNIKTVKYGSPYLGIPDEEINSTAAVKGIKKEDLKGIRRNLFTYNNIMIPSDMQTLVGASYHNSLNLGYSSIAKDKIEKSMQKWYFEYYLPSEIYAVEKGFDVDGYSKEIPIDYNETFWLKSGYIMVNFAIESISDGKRHLSYINELNAKDGYCNMWRKEGYLYSKTDSDGYVFSFSNGDSLLFHADSNNNSAGNDYKTSGTH